MSPRSTPRPTRRYGRACRRCRSGGSANWRSSRSCLRRARRCCVACATDLPMDNNQAERAARPGGGAPTTARGRSGARDAFSRPLPPALEPPRGARAARLARQGGRRRAAGRRHRFAGTTEGHELPGGDAAHAPRRPHRARRGTLAAGGPDVRPRRWQLQVRPLADHAKRSCGASTWTATTTSAIRRCRDATWSPASGACWRSSALAPRLEGGPPRPLHRLERCPTRSPPAVGREQRAS